MGKNQKNTMKYMIIASIQVDGTVQRKDVVGALFGQCEGLLGDDLDLRKLQRSTKIGMIEVNLKSEKGKVKGEILIPSSMDNVETAIIGAAISTIERIGPCNSKIEIKEIQDVRATKRTQVVELAKDLLLKLVSSSSSTSKSVIDEVRSVLTTEQSQFFHGLTCGPNAEEATSLIICEGRNDVQNLLSAGIKNVICTDGAGSIKKELIDLANTKDTITVAIDGDRGGEMLLLQLMGVMKVDFVAQAPVGQEWELLPIKTITKCLAMKEPADRFASRIREKEEEKIQPSEQIKDYAEHITNLDAREAVLIFEDDSTSDPIGVSKLASNIEGAEKTVLAIVYNGQLSKRMYDMASSAGVQTIIGTSIKEGENPNSDVEVWATSDWT